jgi:hypothetical protein
VPVSPDGLEPPTSCQWQVLCPLSYGEHPLLKGMVLVAATLSRRAVLHVSTSGLEPETAGPVGGALVHSASPPWPVLYPLSYVDFAPLRGPGGACLAVSFTIR